MTKLCSVLLLLLMACVVAVNAASAQEKKGKSRRSDAAARWAAIAKGADKEGATELSKEEFVAGVKAAGGRLADQGERLFDRIKKADEKKLTKDEFVKYIESRSKKDADKGGDKKPK